MADILGRQQLPVETLHAFVAAAETGSFTRAAALVHRTQSAVSMQMRRLEDDLGQRLFIRKGRGVSLTEEGRTLLGYARRIARLQDEALSALSSPEMEGVVRLGVTEDYASLHLPVLLANFHTKHPRVRVDVESDTSEVLQEKVLRGELDLSLLTCPANEKDLRPGERNGRLAMEEGAVIKRDPLVWVCANGFEPWRQDPLPLAAYHEGCIFRYWASMALQQQGRKSRILITSPSLGGVLAAVRSGLAVATLGQSMVPEDCTVLGKQQGLPKLPAFTVRLLRGKQRNPVAQSLGDWVEKQQYR